MDGMKRARAAASREHTVHVIRGEHPTAAALYYLYSNEWVEGVVVSRMYWVIRDIASHKSLSGVANKGASDKQMMSACASLEPLFSIRHEMFGEGLWLVSLIKMDYCHHTPCRAGGTP